MKIKVHLHLYVIMVNSTYVTSWHVWKTAVPMASGVTAEKAAIVQM